MSVLRQGRIVYVPMLDPQGRNRKHRPGLIVTPDDLIRAGGPVRVVAITGTVGMSPAEVSVALDWHRSGHPRTRLSRPCEAICSWSELFAPEQLTDAGGYQSGDKLLDILQIVKLLYPATGPSVGTDTTEPTPGGTQPPAPPPAG